MTDTCKICGKELKKLTLTHLSAEHNIHNWSDYTNYKVPVKPAEAAKPSVVESANAQRNH